ncbi:integral membrane protein [Grosmannia clavigera kw1407]|uniref:Integral membrane protein n=1 Tax=Grosmannia clavigera (strain kw1407 / UAMH 11150) TaxID=655863 RepID=F0XDK9_GROCL|nr:uncharacterized protein CMQ_714 [Grosmannia clavigera kw1407]EFX03786.1 integral membrane protein [Grosmannia clavigera kw1407]
MLALETLRGVMAAFMAVDLIVVCVRLFVRIKLTTPGNDDYCIVIALTGFIIMCSFAFVALSYGFGISDAAKIATFRGYDQIKASKFFTVAQLTYVASFPIVRISAAMVLLRIVQDAKPRIKHLLVTSIIVIVVYSLGCILVDALQCIPLKTAWGDGTGKCISSQRLAGLAFAVSALDIASALFYAVLPVFLLKGLQIGLRTKLAIIILLGLSVVTVVISIVRLRSLILIVNTTSVSTTLSLELESFVFSALELGISILTASLVALRPLLKYMPFGSRGRSSGARGRSAPYGTSGLCTSGPAEFEMGHRLHSEVADANSDDAESQRDILREDGNNGVWKRSKVSVTYEAKPKDGGT